MSILVIAAHPDDEVLGCGATIAKASVGEETHVVILGEGATSRYSRREDAQSDEIEGLRESARAAAAILGVRSIEFVDLPDNRFDEVALLDVVKHVERHLDRVRPTTVYTHHPGDLNIDHQVAFRATLTASRPQPGASVRELLTFEVPSSTEWSFQRVGPPFRPDVFVDVSSTFQCKLDALARYGGEMRSYPHPRSYEAIAHLAQRWGSVVGLSHAEAFELVRSIRA